MENSELKIFKRNLKIKNMRNVFLNLNFISKRMEQGKKCSVCKMIDEEFADQ